ncbi:thioesterase [Bacillus thuringiensis]|uniref:thioesterase II family protein n=1 Tax=Bacillus thuringiensis TaxID=1428 RepID=UPI000BFAA3D2|nr:alpha/beta fold hydrolase [Bacillus thuringiensis]PFF02783.1 thioesterase [Bacillus thuringiensis]
MNHIKLFCFPYAGGSSSIYMKWRSKLSPSIQLIPIELAGRGRRIQESFYQSFDDAINDIVQEIEKRLDGTPFAFFGHSMGSLLAYECAHKLMIGKKMLPELIIVSGKNPPHLKRKKQMHQLSDDEFRRELLLMGGFEKGIVENNELFNFFVPILRADFRLVETYNYNEKQDKIDSDIVVLYGKDDNLTTIEELDEWCIHAKRQPKIYAFDGGHFFINDQFYSIVHLINILVGRINIA